MNVIFIRALRVPALVGVYDWEKQGPQTIELQLEIGLRSGKSFLSDDLNDTIDYDELCQLITRDLAARRFQLLEALVEHIADRVINDFGAKWVKLSAAKLGVVPNTHAVGVQIERHASAIEARAAISRAYAQALNGEKVR
ncbi:MAG: dihydroneopterin aldolase [Burkholderiales bacterium]